MEIFLDTHHQKVREEHMDKKPLNSIVLKLQVIYSLAKQHSSYYSVSCEVSCGISSENLQSGNEKVSTHTIRWIQ